MLEQINEIFFEEANELLESLEGYLLSLEQNPDNPEIISAVFRVMHTIKGSSGMFGFDAISSFTHEVESTFDAVRNGSAPVTPQLISLTLKARDHIMDMLKGNVDKEESAALIQENKYILNFFPRFTSRQNNVPRHITCCRFYLRKGWNLSCKEQNSGCTHIRQLFYHQRRTCSVL